MTVPSAITTRSSRPWISFLAGGAVGFGILALTQVLSETQIAFGPFALSGNGALAMPLIGFPLAFYAGWTWLTDRHAGGRRQAMHLAAYSLGLVLGAGLLGVLFALPIALVTGAIYTTWMRSQSVRKSDALLWIAFAMSVVLSALPVLGIFGVALLPGSLTVLARSRGTVGRIALGALLAAVTIVIVFGVPLLFMGARAT